MKNKELMFPNKNKKDEPQTTVTEENKKQQQENENKKIKERIELLEKEKQLEEDREKRIHKKARRMGEAQFRKAIRKRQAMRMRMRNIPVDVIAEKLKITPSYAASLIKEAVSELPEETSDDLRKLLGRTVIQLIGNFEKMALEGGVREAEVMLKGITQLMKLSGLSIQKQQIEQTNMEVGSISSGIDVADLDLDLETKKKILTAMRNNKKIQDSLKKENEQEITDESDDADETDEI